MNPVLLLWYNSTMKKRCPVLDHPFVRALYKFQHSPRTDLALRRVNNKDFIVLCMFAVGPIGLAELRALCGAWRGLTYGHCADVQHLDDRKLDPYFTPHYGHTAADFAGARRYKGPFCSARHPKYWYRLKEHRRGVRYPGFWRPMERYQNDLTQQGLARARELLQCPRGPLRGLLPRDLAHDTSEAVIGHVVEMLQREFEEGGESVQGRIEDLGGAVDTSQCGADSIMADPRVYAALRMLVDGSVGRFQQLGDE